MSRKTKTINNYECVMLTHRRKQHTIEVYDQEGTHVDRLEYTDNTIPEAWKNADWWLNREEYQPRWPDGYENYLYSWDTFAWEKVS